MAKRRASGEGNIRKRKDERWEGRYTAGYDPQTGKRITKNVLGKTQAEVREKLKAAIKQAEETDLVRGGQYTLVQWLHYWMDNYGKVYLRPSSQVNYNGFLNHQIADDPVMGTIKLLKVRGRDLQTFYARMAESGRVVRRESKDQPKGLSPKSIRNMHFFISHALEQAVKEKLITENPCRNCVLPRREKKEMKTLPLDDLNAFFAEAKRSGIFELYYTEMATGLRRGELVGIKWSDINFDENSIYIQRQITRVNGVVQESPLKTANAYRQIIVPPEVTAMLREKMERENGKSVYAFSAKSGDAMCPDSMLDMLHRVLKRAGLPQVRFHDLRHTFATLALQNGVDVKTLSGLLGHYSAGFTLDTYGHITPAMKQDAANKIGGFLSGTA